RIGQAVTVVIQTHAANWPADPTRAEEDFFGVKIPNAHRAGAEAACEVLSCLVEGKTGSPGFVAGQEFFLARRRVPNRGSAVRSRDQMLAIWSKAQCVDQVTALEIVLRMIPLSAGG